MMAGHRLIDQDGVEVQENATKKTRPLSSHLEGTSLVNRGFTIWLKLLYFPVLVAK